MFSSYFRSISINLLLAALVALPACSKAPEAKTPATVAAQPRTFTQQHPSVPQRAPDSPTAAAVHISDEIVRACGISEPDAYFAFDSARLTESDTRVLGQIAGCFSSGPLKGRQMNLVGRADPRGAQEYNMTLGQSRADSVEKYLESKGLQKTAVQTTSRGAMDAVGTDEPSWARDRRVDILLKSN